MGLARLSRLLRQHRRIALDSCIFIYQLESNPRYVNLTDAIFAWLDQGSSSAVTSTLTATEVLVKPYLSGSEAISDAVYLALCTSASVTFIAPDFSLCDDAARLRAQYRLRTPDAIQLASALHVSATAFFTNDKALRRVSELEVVVLDDLLQ